MNDKLRECLRKAVASVNGPLLTDKSNEQAGWAAVSFLQSHGAELLAILDAEGDGGAVSKMVSTAPKVIYLQIADEDCSDENFPENDEISWCADSCLSCEVKYLREDLAIQPPQNPVMVVTDAMADTVARHLQSLGWASGGDFETDFEPDVRAALTHFAQLQVNQPARSGVVSDAKVRQRFENLYRLSGIENDDTSAKVSARIAYVEAWEAAIKGESNV